MGLLPSWPPSSRNPKFKQGSSVAAMPTGVLLERTRPDLAPKTTMTLRQKSRICSAALLVCATVATLHAEASSGHSEVPCFSIHVRLNGKMVDGPQTLTIKTKERKWCQGRSKTRPLWRSKSRPVDGCEGVGLFRGEVPLERSGRGPSPLRRGGDGCSASFIGISVLKAGFVYGGSASGGSCRRSSPGCGRGG